MSFTNSGNRSFSQRVCGSLLVVLLAVAGIGGSVARAQLSGKGEIKGTVTDPTGAVVAGAAVTATAVATGVATRATLTLRRLNRASTQ